MIQVHVYAKFDILRLQTYALQVRCISSYTGGNLLSV